MEENRQSSAFPAFPWLQPFKRQCKATFQNQDFPAPSFCLILKVCTVLSRNKCKFFAPILFTEWLINIISTTSTFFREQNGNSGESFVSFSPLLFITISHLRIFLKEKCEFALPFVMFRVWYGNIRCVDCPRNDPVGGNIPQNERAR